MKQRCVITRTTRAYIAGIIDGEGSIGIHRQHPRPHGKSATYRVKIHVSNIYLPLLEWLKDLFGGTIYHLSEPRRRKPCYNWSLMGPPAVDVLRTIYPFLRVKAAQAWLALEFCAQCPSQQGRRLSSEQVALREGYYLALQAAKRL